jgi:DNA-binding transcriptional ArsR family regulator
LQSNSYIMNLRRDVFQAIADPTRRAIVVLVASQAMTAGAIASNFDTARPTVSKHLQILTECKLLQQEQMGREVYYNLNPDKMKEIADFVEPFRKMWDDRFNKLETVLKNLKKNGK